MRINLESWRASRRAILAGAIGAAAASAAFLANNARPTHKAEAPAPVYVGMDTPNSRRISEEMKDHGRYYDSATERRLRRAAEEGDEWAVRELPWPAGHPLHKKGRPFSRNEKPHPKGLFPNSGY